MCAHAKEAVVGVYNGILLAMLDSDNGKVKCLLGPPDQQIAPTLLPFSFYT